MIKVILLTILLFFAAANTQLAWLGFVIFLIFIIIINLFNSDVVIISDTEFIVKNMLTGVKAKYRLNDLVKTKLVINAKAWKTPRISHLLILKQKNGTDDELKVNLPFITMFSIEKRINDQLKEMNR